MSNKQMSVSVPPDIDSRVAEEAKRNGRSKSAIVRDALTLYFRLRHIPFESASVDEQAAIAEGRADAERGDAMTFDEWRHAVGLANH